MIDPAVEAPGVVDGLIRDFLTRCDDPNPDWDRVVADRLVPLIVEPAVGGAVVAEALVLTVTTLRVAAVMGGTTPTAILDQVQRLRGVNVPDGTRAA